MHDAGVDYEDIRQEDLSFKYHADASKKGQLLAEEFDSNLLEMLAGTIGDILGTVLPLGDTEIILLSSKRILNSLAIYERIFPLINDETTFQKMIFS